MSQTQKEIWQKIKDLKLDDSMKNYLLNCDNDGILTKRDADHLRSIGKYVTVEDMKSHSNECNEINDNSLIEVCICGDVEN